MSEMTEQWPPEQHELRRILASKTTEQWKVRTIRVYRDSHVWDQYKPWFKVPLDTLDSLYIETYAMPGDASTHEMERAADEIRVIHPNTVLVY